MNVYAYIYIYIANTTTMQTIHILLNMQKTCMYINVCIHYTQMYIYIYLYTYLCIYIYIYTHTHMFEYTISDPQTYEESCEGSLEP